MDDEAQAMSHVRRSKQVLEETFQTGAAILTNMAGQRERLKVAPDTFCPSVSRYLESARRRFYVCNSGVVLALTQWLKCMRVAISV